MPPLAVTVNPGCLFCADVSDDGSLQMFHGEVPDDRLDTYGVDPGGLWHTPITPYMI
jgi:hypothetical protein